MEKKIGVERLATLYKFYSVVRIEDSDLVTDGTNLIQNRIIFLTFVFCIIIFL